MELNHGHGILHRERTISSAMFNYFKNNIVKNVQRLDLDYSDYLMSLKHTKCLNPFISMYMIIKHSSI